MRRRRFFELLAGVAVTGMTHVRGANKSKIAVAGGGIIGASIAYHLARRGAEVVLFEKERPAAGATGKSFAWINANFAKQPRQYNDLNRLSMLAYHQLQRELKGKLAVQWHGQLHWEDDPERAQRLQSGLREHQQWGYDIHLVDEKEFQRLEPNVVPGQVLAASFSAMEGSLDPVQANNLLIDEARASGARIEYPCQVTDLDLRWGRLRGVKTSCGNFEADVLVIASGVDTPQLAARAGLEIPMRDAPGILAHTTPSDRVINRVLRAPEGEMKQKLDGRLVAGPGFYGDHGTDNSREAGEKILDQVKSILPDTKIGELERVTLGWRPLPRDGHPVVGFNECCPDVYLAVMHSGITLCPIIGRLAALEILDDVRADLLEPFRVSRFAERRRS